MESCYWWLPGAGPACQRSLPLGARRTLRVPLTFVKSFLPKSSAPCRRAPNRPVPEDPHGSGPQPKQAPNARPAGVSARRLLLLSVWEADPSRLGGDEVADEDEGLAWLDGRARAAVAVAEVRGDDQLAAAADPHALHALVPALDDLPDAELEAQRLAAAPARVEFLTAGVGDAYVVHLDGVAGAGDLPLARPDVGDLKRRGRLALRVVHFRLCDFHASYLTED